MRALGATGETISLRGESTASDEADGYLKGSVGEGQYTDDSVLELSQLE